MGLSQCKRPRNNYTIYTLRGLTVGFRDRKGEGEREGHVTPSDQAHHSHVYDTLTVCSD